MVGRLVLGLVIGSVLGAAVAVGMVAGLGMTTLGPVIGYLAAALTGALTGLFAGKPIWAAGAQIEAGLKSVFGAAIAAGMLFALRSWFNPSLSLPFLHPDLVGKLGDLPVVLPVLAALLGGFYGLDNTPAADEGKNSGSRATPKSRIAEGKKRVAQGGDEADEEGELPAPPKKAKR